VTLGKKITSINCNHDLYENILKNEKHYTMYNIITVIIFIGNLIKAAEIRKNVEQGTSKQKSILADYANI
jgi:hypothetical protein